MYPRYTDVSHFRAPYKDAIFSGYGDAAAAPGAPGSAVTMVEPDGTRVVKPDLVATFYPLLAAMSIISLGGSDEAIQLDPRVEGDVREGAMSWANRKLQEGKSLILGNTGGIDQGINTSAGVATLQAVKGHAEELKYAGPGTLPVTAVFVRPPSAAGSATAGKVGSPGKGMGVVGFALVALVAAGGVYYLATRKKKKRAA